MYTGVLESWEKLRLQSDFPRTQTYFKCHIYFFLIRKVRQNTEKQRKKKCFFSFQTRMTRWSPADSRGMELIYVVFCGGRHLLLNICLNSRKHNSKPESCGLWVMIRQGKLISCGKSTSQWGPGTMGEGHALDRYGMRHV